MKINFQPKQINKEAISNLKKKIGNLPNKMPPMAGKVLPPDIFKPNIKDFPVTSGLIRPPKISTKGRIIKEVLLANLGAAVIVGTAIGIDAIVRKIKAAKEAKAEAAKMQEVKTLEVKNTQEIENDAIIMEEENKGE